MCTHIYCCYSKWGKKDICRIMANGPLKRERERERWWWWLNCEKYRDQLLLFLSLFCHTLLMYVYVIYMLHICVALDETYIAR